MLRHQSGLALQVLLSVSFLAAWTSAGLSAPAGDPCDGKAPLVKHGHLAPTQEEDGVALAQNVVRLLHLSDDLRLEGMDLIRELERLLANIRAHWPEMAEVRARGHWSPGDLVLRLETSLLQAVVKSLAEEGASAPLCTGRAAFDALNQTVGLRSVSTFPRFNTILLGIEPRNDPLRTALKYETIEGVKSARPEARIGDSSDIQALRSDGKWHVVFRKAWGDCPSGCIHSELHYFVEYGLNVSRIDHANAAAMPEFVEILAARGWTRRHAGGRPDPAWPAKEMRRP